MLGSIDDLLGSGDVNGALMVLDLVAGGLGVCTLNLLIFTLLYM